MLTISSKLYFAFKHIALTEHTLFSNGSRKLTKTVDRLSTFSTQAFLNSTIYGFFSFAIKFICNMNTCYLHLNHFQPINFFILIIFPQHHYSRTISKESTSFVLSKKHKFHNYQNIRIFHISCL